MVSLGFFSDLILPAASGLGIDSTSNTNKSQWYLLGAEGKDGRYVELTT